MPSLKGVASASVVVAVAVADICLPVQRLQKCIGESHFIMGAGGTAWSSCCVDSVCCRRHRQRRRHRWRRWSHARPNKIMRNRNVFDRVQQIVFATVQRSDPAVALALQNRGRGRVSWQTRPAGQLLHYSCQRLRDPRETEANQMQ